MQDPPQSQSYQLQPMQEEGRPLDHLHHTTKTGRLLPTLPEALRSPTYAIIRHAFYTVYRRLFSVVFVANSIALFAIVHRSHLQHDCVNATAANLLASALARNPLVINFLYICLCSLPRSAPFCLRRSAANTYHYGGVHSGCGIAAVLWYLAFVGTATWSFTSQGNTTVSVWTLGLAYSILVLLLGIIMAAYPKIRARLHDYFEFMHRFASWIIIALFWPLLISSIHDAQARRGISLGQSLVSLPAFWMLLATTIMIIHPWLYLCKVPVVPEWISPHVIRLHFGYTLVDFSQTISLSNHPFGDWHSFATFPDPGRCGFSCLVSRAGDWTSDLIERQPTHMWKRSLPVYNFLYAVGMFRKAIIVATGSGVGPCLSFLGDEHLPPCRLVWQTRNPVKTYGQNVLDLVKKLDAEALVIDTDKSGRQDMLPLVWDLLHEYEAEVVFVVSNPTVTKKLVFDLEARGVAAYGPIFDS